MKKFQRHSILLLVVLLFTACGGGGESTTTPTNNTSTPPLTIIIDGNTSNTTPTDNNNDTPNNNDSSPSTDIVDNNTSNTPSSPIEINVNDEVVVPKEEITISALTKENNSSRMTVQGEITEANTLVNKIVYIPPSETSSDGFFMKVTSIEKGVDTQGNTVSNISYEVPELHEIIKEMKVEERNILEDDVQVSQVVIPKPTNIAASSPVLKGYYKANKMLMASKGTAGVMFGNAKEDGVIDIGYVSEENKNHFKFAFNGLELWKGKDSNNSETSIVFNAGVELKLNELTPVSEIKVDDKEYAMKFDSEYEVLVSGDITAQGNFDFDLVDVLGEESKYQCGELKYVEEFGSREEGLYTSLSFEGAKMAEKSLSGWLYS